MIVSLSLFGCKTTEEKSSFSLSTDRVVLAEKTAIPKSGKVVLFLKDREQDLEYKRLDFDY